MFSQAPWTPTYFLFRSYSQIFTEGFATLTYLYYYILYRYVLNEIFKTLSLSVCYGLFIYYTTDLFIPFYDKFVLTAMLSGNINSTYRITNK